MSAFSLRIHVMALLIDFFHGAKLSIFHPLCRNMSKNAGFGCAPGPGRHGMNESPSHSTRQRLSLTNTSACLLRHLHTWTGPQVASSLMETIEPTNASTAKQSKPRRSQPKPVFLRDSAELSAPDGSEHVRTSALRTPGPPRRVARSSRKTLRQA